ncbi:hypothetical protein [Helicobacter sp. MIT 14-3879]|uniref:hypothetical protein n=1 Tax=Helicobacter sp. MIT 14-3879 TaxID=2040649 RepID=UPI000E1F9939|nr:hypothetical protein [Helicobacter sp. MIT 14-3879]RDU63972.1 hypothetical protein CQA44_04855 [Helicobacter sp. MIT 14-3879]
MKIKIYKFMLLYLLIGGGVEAKDSYSIAECSGNTCIINNSVKNQIGIEEFKLTNTQGYYDKVEVDVDFNNKIYISKDASLSFMNINEFINNANLRVIGNALEVNTNTSITTLINNGIIGNQTYSSNSLGLVLQNGGEINTLNNNGVIYKLSIIGNSKINTLNNNGVILSNGANNAISINNSSIGIINNSGTISGIIDFNNVSNPLILNNTGYILLDENVSNKYHLSATAVNGNINKVNITNYTLKIAQNSQDFNSFNQISSDSDSNNSHIIIKDNNNTFQLRNNKPIAVFINDSLELGGEYSLNKIFLAANNSNNNLSDYDITDTNNTSIKDNYALLDFLRVDERSNSPVLNYVISKGSANNTFVVNKHTNASNGVINTTVKASVVSMNSLINKTNSLIFNNKIFPEIKLSFNRYISLEELRNNQNFYYKDILKDEINYLDNVRSNQANRNSTRELRNRATSNYATKINRNSNNTSNTNNQNINFFFAPFISHTMFYNDGLDYSGLDYGFITGINTKLANIHTIGLNLGFSYGELKENIWNTNLTNMTINAGLHYKLNLIFNMYVKLKGDIFYFIDNIKYIESKINKNNLGFALSSTFGKNFNLNNFGIIGLELGINYQGLNSSSIRLDTESYSNSFLNLAYADFSLNYSKVFSNFWLIDALLGVKTLTTKPTNSLKIKDDVINYNIGLDRVLGYVNLGIGYSLDNKVEFSIDYLGMFGNKSINNSGFFNIKAWL